MRVCCTCWAGTWGSHTLSVDAEGRLYAWGRVSFGRLGLESTTPVISIPTVVPAMAKVWGRVHSVKPTAFTPPPPTEPSPECARPGLCHAPAGYASAALCEHRALCAVVRVDCGGPFVCLTYPSACAVSLFCMRCVRGRGRGRDLGSVLQRIVVSASAGESHSAAIDDRGTLFMWGENSHGKLSFADGHDRCVRG